MDNNRLLLAMVISIAILIGFEALLPHHNQAQLARQATETTRTTPSGATPPPTDSVATPGTQPVAVAPPREVPRLPIDAPKLSGSLSLVGARLDDVVLRDYHETVNKSSPLVRWLEPPSDPQPTYIQYGWVAAAGTTVLLPDSNTLWEAHQDGPLRPGHPVTLTWNNGAGLTFSLVVSIDDDYMFGITQAVHNATLQPVRLYPYARVKRDYTPQVAGYYILHEGLLGVIGGTLKEQTYKAAKAAALKNDGVSLTGASSGGWAGITDKYWLAALVPDQDTLSNITFRHTLDNGADRYEVDAVPSDAETVPAGGNASYVTHAFAGAKVVTLLDHYEAALHIPNFDHAVDFGWFYLLTKPIFYALDWLNGMFGNFGVAIIVFTIGVKALFFPLATRSYRSMSKMKLLGPKIKAMREQYNDDPAKQQSEMMAIYRNEKVNPAAGCLPMLIQIPVFFSLYKDIFVTIEMRHAPFFGWIRDLSAVDPTNVFNLFGLLPFDPSALSPFLHLGAWPIIMGCTMFAQQKMNPPPPDPTQARLFQFMPIIFTFMLARFPAGLVIYWSTNNTLTVLQQWLIQRGTKLEGKTRTRVART